MVSSTVVNTVSSTYLAGPGEQPPLSLVASPPDTKRRTAKALFSVTAWLAVAMVFSRKIFRQSRSLISTFRLHGTIGSHSMAFMDKAATSEATVCLSLPPLLPIHTPVHT